MYSLLLVIIYLAFISLGLPDSLLGSAWPVMRSGFNASISFAGIISMIISGGTIVSSLLSDRLTRKLGTGLVTAISVAMTAIALFGFYSSQSLIQICLWCIPFGLGAGAVDAALNNYVALYYSARHMSWLHCFWGVGASISPYIMGSFLTNGNNWRGGYGTVSIIQIGLALLLFSTLSVWKVNQSKGINAEESASRVSSLKEAVKIPGVVYVLVAFFGYCACESTAGLWASSYLVEVRNVDVQTAARFASLFYLGITFGRFINGFVADTLGDKKLIRIGTSVMSLGVVLIMLPVKTNLFALAGLVIIGFGCAPVYPSIIHATPFNFGEENSQAIIGIQMASAYVGTTFIPPLFGLIAKHISLRLYPFYLIVFVLLLIAMTELMNKLNANKAKNIAVE